MSSSTSSSNIKGGGRATMSKEVEESIISLLQSVRDERNPLLPKSSKPPPQKGLSNHELQRNQKQLLKKLLECHNRHVSSQQVNKTSSPQPGSPQEKTKRKDVSRSKNTNASSNEKVRVQLAQAIPSSSKKKSKSNKKNSTKASWKEGSVRKVIVLNRSTGVSQVAQEAKLKLRLKQQPNRVFCIQNKIEVDLETDLQGIKDGTVLYVSCGQDSAKSIETSSESKEGVDNNDAFLSPPLLLDPLETVKRTYKERRRRSPRSTDLKREDGRTFRKINFTDCLHDLKELSPSRAELPAAMYRENILITLDQTRVLIVCGETGCGKSTQVPQFILEGLQAQKQDYGDFHNDMVLVTQPRRVAAMSLAERVANERSSPIPGNDGAQVGYIVRLAKAMSPPATKLVFCTVGILLRMLVTDSQNDSDGLSLSRCSVLVIDEVHERDLNTDFCLTLLKTLLKRQANFKIVLMSATTSPQLFVNYFSRCIKEQPQVISIPGRTFPVTHYYLSDCEKLSRTQLEGWNSGFTAQYQEEDDCSTSDEYFEATDTNQDQQQKVALSPRAISPIDNSFVCRLIGSILRKDATNEKRQQGQKNEEVQTSGSILVFLPGKGEIDSLAHTLYNDSFIGNKKKCRIFMLHSKTHPAEQRAVFQPVSGAVKIVLATNVAETSITIPDVSVVIDTGRVKESRFNSSTRIKELTTVWTSQASATQRAGRAGRTGPGVCYKLYTKDFCERHMPLRTSPEMVRTPLDELILQVCLLEESQRDAKSSTEHGEGEKGSDVIVGTSPVLFLNQAPEPPETRQVEFACKHLLEAGALTLVTKEGSDALFRLTPLGYHLAHLPMDAKVGKVLIVGCILECVKPSLTIAAALCCPKTCWLKDTNRQGQPKTAKNTTTARELQKHIVRNGFGGEDWKGGTVKGDNIAVIAAYNAWSSRANNKERRNFARENALDHGCLCEIYNLRRQFRESLVYAGFLEDAKEPNNDTGTCLSCNDDALLTSCCLVAGLYPNIATLLRPNKALRIRGGRLVTKDGNACRPSSSSFQTERIRNASEGGKDAYAVFHSKHRMVGTTSTSKPASMPHNNNKSLQQQECFLSEINFVSRYSILLFGGEIEFKDNNALVVDGWLKFKIGDKGQKSGAVLVQELRRELDNVILKRIAVSTSKTSHDEPNSLQSECKQVMEVVRKLLAEE